jgi:hypothetical protein
MTNGTVAPITFVPAAQEQHMLFLFLPLKQGLIQPTLGAVSEIAGRIGPAEPAAEPAADLGPDNRGATGVHFFMFYGLAAGTAPTPAMPVPTFQTAKDKDLLVVISIYDADFAPYISAFGPIFGLLDTQLLPALDETDIQIDDPTSSAAYIMANGGVEANSTGFLKLLMRYNFADPTIPAAAVGPVNTPANPKYFLGATFPGLTVGSILQSYPNATSLYPWPAQSITFEASQAPPSAS